MSYAGGTSDITGLLITITQTLHFIISLAPVSSFYFLPGQLSPCWPWVYFYLLDFESEFVPLIMLQAQIRSAADNFASCVAVNPHIVQFGSSIALSRFGEAGLRGLDWCCGHSVPCTAYSRQLLPLEKEWWRCWPPANVRPKVVAWGISWPRR